ncbi:MAG TPA: hypothetical protein VHV77_01795, partial [Pirellulales bacterium]|nr:hypothetical protein [Pirellulales bacterium]
MPRRTSQSFAAFLAVTLFTTCVPAAEAPTAPPPGSGAAMAMANPGSFTGRKLRMIEGFTCVLSDEMVENLESSKYKVKPIDVLSQELKAISEIFPPDAVKMLRGLLIWIDWDDQVPTSNGRGMSLAYYYPGGQQQAISEGKHPLTSKNITIVTMKSLTQSSQRGDRPWGSLLLHELTHAVHDQWVGRENPAIKAAYAQAMERKLYDPNMYCSTNEKEYFAELTCSYFNLADFYPHNRSDLKKHDPIAHQVMEQVWGKREVKTDATASASGASSEALMVKLGDIKLGKHIYGRALEKSDLKDRASIIMLWNMAADTSMQAFPKMNAWDRELADFGLATVAVHLTAGKQKGAKDVADSRNVVFSVTESPWSGDSLIKDFKEFPLCFVFDHAGRCVFRGPPFDAEEAMRTALGGALVARSEVETWPKLLQPLVDSLLKGKAPAQVFSQLVVHVRSRDAATAEAAKKLVAEMTREAEKTLAHATATAEEDPVAAYLEVERLPLVLKGTTLATDANTLLGKLKRFPAVQLELRARPTLLAIEKIEYELSTKPGSFDPTLDYFRKDNHALLQQLQQGVAMMKKSWPEARATKQALKTAD